MNQYPLGRPITKRYMKNQETLKLQNYRNCWVDVIKERDWKMLKSLNISHCDISDHDLQIILDLQWPELSIICLCKNLSEAASNKITGFGAIELSKKKWPKLDSVWLNDNNLEDKGVQLLQNFQNKLLFLILNNCKITDEGMRKLLNFEITNLIRLQLSMIFLNLYKNLLGSFGAKWLSKANLFNIRKLSIVDCQIGQQGHKHLSKAKWPNLSDIRHSDMLVWGNKDKIYSGRGDKIKYLGEHKYKLVETIKNILCSLDIGNMYPSGRINSILND